MSLSSFVIDPGRKDGAATASRMSRPGVATRSRNPRAFTEAGHPMQPAALFYRPSRRQAAMSRPIASSSAATPGNSGTSPNPVTT